MKLPTTSALMLFLNSVSASAKITTGGDDHMMHDLLAKVEAQDAKIADLKALHDAKIANLEALHDAKLEAQDAKIAKLEALLLGAPRVPQGKKNLSHRGLRRTRPKSNKKNVFDKNSNEEDATIDIAATLADFDTAGEKVDDMLARHGVSSVLNSLIIQMGHPFFNCLTHDQDSQTCTLGSEYANTVDIISGVAIKLNANGGDIVIEAGDGGKFKFSTTICLYL